MEYGRFVESTQVVAVAPHVAEDLGCCIRERIRRDTSTMKDVQTGGHFRASHPACDHWLPGRLGIRFEALSGLGRLSHALWTKNGQQAIHIGIIHNDVHDFRVRVGKCVT